MRKSSLQSSESEAALLTWEKNNSNGDGNQQSSSRGDDDEEGGVSGLWSTSHIMSSQTKNDEDRDRAAASTRHALARKLEQGKESVFLTGTGGEGEGEGGDGEGAEAAAEREGGVGLEQGVVAVKNETVDEMIKRLETTYDLVDLSLGAEADLPQAAEGDDEENQNQNPYE